MKFGWIICKFKGHMRRKRFVLPGGKTGLRCPRCMAAVKPTLRKGAK